jgi:fused signal recognition particle receptor
LPTPIDPEVFKQSVPELVNPERFEIDPDTITPLPDFPDVEPENPFLGTDDDAEPELAQPEAEVAPEVAPEPQPEVQPEVAPEVQPEVRVNNSEVAPEELPATPETVTPKVVTPEVVTTEVVTPEITPTVIIPDVSINTDV